MVKKPLPERMVSRLMNSFSSQIVRRAARGAGVPQFFIPAVSQAMREVNKQIQWGNPVVWNRRMQKMKELFDMIKEQQTEVSPVYRHRGLSKTVRAQMKQVETPHVSSEPPKKSSIDKTKIFFSGLAVMVTFSLVGPMIAKRANWVDPLDVKSDPQGMVFK